MNRTVCKPDRRRRCILYSSNILYGIVLFLIYSCSTSNNIYTIKAGQHYSKHNVSLLDEPAVNFTFRGDSSWYYTTEFNGISKICGFSEGLHHTNSARLGYICKDNVLYLAMYCYVDGKEPNNNDSTNAIIEILDIATTYNCSIYREEDRYVFLINKNKYSCNAAKISDVNQCINYLLYPYVGGTYTLDHDWTCLLMIY